MKNRPDSKMERMKIHHVAEWDKESSCNKNTMEEDLNQALDWDLVTCKKCLRKRVSI